MTVDVHAVTVVGRCPKVPVSSADRLRDGFGGVSRGRRDALVDQGVVRVLREAERHADLHVGRGGAERSRAAGPAAGRLS